jgi:hypothetical protein
MINGFRSVTNLLKTWKVYKTFQVYKTKAKTSKPKPNLESL